MEIVVRIRLLNVNGVNLPIRFYRFDDHGTPLHVLLLPGRSQAVGIQFPLSCFKF
jgi:hypothetical protein